MALYYFVIQRETQHNFNAHYKYIVPDTGRKLLETESAAFLLQSGLKILDDRQEVIEMIRRLVSERKAAFINFYSL